MSNISLLCNTLNSCHSSIRVTVLLRTMQSRGHTLKMSKFLTCDAASGKSCQDGCVVFGCDPFADLCNHMSASFCTHHLDARANSEAPGVSIWPITLLRVGFNTLIIRHALVNSMHSSYRCECNEATKP